MKCTVNGKIYSETATYYDWDNEKEFPKFEAIEGTEMKWEIEADSLDEAEKWFAENYPERYMGGGIVCENGDFAMMAVPCGEYCKGDYETIEARINWVRRCVLAH